MYYLKFLLLIIVLNFVLSIVFYNPNVFFLVLIILIGYIAYRSYKVSKQRDQFYNDFNQQQNYYNNTNQQDYYDNQNQYTKNNSDIIDVEYTQKDISEENDKVYK